MKLLYKITFFLLLLCCMTSCIDELNVETEEALRLLVVEGAIDTNYGPHRIKLSRSAKYGSILEDQIQKITGATVWVRDREGNQVFLTETIDGLYQTPSTFKGEVGNAYTLNITLLSGERYISTTEEIQAAPSIDDIIIVNDNPFRSGVEAFVEWKDPADINNFYLLETDGVYIVDARPWLFIGRGPFGNPTPMPKDCCERCYVSEFSVDDELMLYKDNQSDGGVFRELAGFIPDNGRRFMEKYMLVVKLSSLTTEAFQFLDLVKEQLSIEGNIFDPPPATIRGNMINLDNPDEDVIGYFRASDVTTDTVFMNTNNLVDPVPTNWLDDDCRVLEFSTINKPPYWP